MDDSLIDRCCTMWRGHLPSVALLIAVALGYPSYYLQYHGCIGPTAGMTIMNRRVSMTTGSLLLSPAARIQAGGSTTFTITAPSSGQFLLYVSGGTASTASPWASAVTCPQLLWTTAPSTRATITITGGRSGVLDVRGLWAPAYGAATLVNVSVVLGGGGCTDSTQSDGSAWYDSGGPSYTCATYYNVTGKCDSDGGSYSNFGMNADAACCNCGGGIRGRSCADLTLSSGQAWYDNGGPSYTCATYYSQAGKCTSEGNSFANGGLTAGQACCVCGGGTGSGTSSPTPSPTTGRCVDVMVNGGAWYDSGGPSYNCNYYQQNSKCSIEGTSFSNNGYTASQACCACGGGSTGRGTLTPTSSPTPPPTTTPGCQDIPFPNGQSWYDSGGTGYNCAQYYRTQSVCLSDGLQYSNQGMTASIACCTCGGGMAARGTTCWAPPTTSSSSTTTTTVVNLCLSGTTCVSSSPSSSSPSLGTCQTGSGTGGGATGLSCWIGYNIPPTAACPSGYTCNPIYSTFNLQQIMPGTCAPTPSSPSAGTQLVGGVCVLGGPYATLPSYNCAAGLSCITITSSVSSQYAVGTCQNTPTSPPTSVTLPCLAGVTTCPSGQSCISGFCLTPAQSGGLGADCTTTRTCNAGLTCYLQTLVTRTCQFTGSGQPCTINANCGANLACLPTGVFNPPAACQPTTSVTTGGCKDTVLPGTIATPWHDAYSPTNTCANQYTKPGMCQSIGNAYAFQGLTANMACCVCGGGVKT